ncbi:MAG: hypothetical protein GW763_13610 [Paraglaciecola sp.]|nr:hypothetical protein [Paraglaciecola sp.]NCT48997.1 hypothetical protein [Paraglaciecola sp.]
MTRSQPSHLTVYQSAILTELGIVDWVGQSANTDQPVALQPEAKQSAQNISSASPAATIEKLRELNQKSATNQAPQRVVCDFKADNTSTTIVQDILLAIGHSSLPIEYSGDVNRSSVAAKSDAAVFAWCMGEQCQLSAHCLTTPSLTSLLQVQHKKALWQLLQTQYSE